MWASKLLGRRHARLVATQTAASFASAPTLNAESSVNTQAFSAVIAEVMEGLGFILDHINDQEEPGDLLRLHLERLAKEISKYHNSKVNDQDVQPWECSPELAQLLLAACRCSCSVYGLEDSPGLDLVPIISRTPSKSGTVKAASIWKMESTKTLYIAIRGTACAADHMVNFNRRGKDAAATFCFPGIDPIFTHGGFLACAKALLPWMMQEIIRQAQLDPSMRHVVFTGHSAGGAVAAIVFLHFICRDDDELSSIDSSLVTFGAPPITSTNITHLAEDLPRTRHILAFVNEYDLVPRADGPYIASIIDLYRLSYERSPNSQDLGPKSRTNVIDDERPDTWDVLPPDYHILGQIVILRLKLGFTSLETPSGQSLLGQVMPTRHMDMVQITPSTFSQLLFFDTSIHKRRVYLSRIEEIYQGQKGHARPLASS